ncbi:MAG TPA: tRNA lysidine(34) synthetase TilS [Thermoanaerobaculia bacterium]|nr:tRNA lysidine(34) synthetase TilS [Thermoanaerobaculia bacterium]
MHPDPLEAALSRAVATDLLPRGARILLAVSGGSDSTALLHAAALHGARFGWSLAAGHVHHGWRGRDADRDLAFVRESARRLEIAFLLRAGDARRTARELRVSPEAGARQLRYAALREMAAEAGAVRIATAHHADDHLETYFVARERNGGPASLGGPRQRREDGLVRPLLEVSRLEIATWLEARGISWRRDATNGDLRLARNRIRRELAAATAAQRAGWLEEARRWSARRDWIDREFARRIGPALRRGPDSVLADAELFERCEPDLQRRAVEAASAPFARPGHPPMTGREREEVLRRLAAGADFRFEAGRRIAIERKGRILAFALRRDRAPGSRGVRHS